MFIEPITFTVNPWLFIAFCVYFAFQLTLVVLYCIDCIDKPKRKKRH